MATGVLVYRGEKLSRRAKEKEMSKKIEISNCVIAATKAMQELQKHYFKRRGNNPQGEFGL
jgi:hypothetical protein